jgi:preprotein translocase subunit SecG
VFGSSPRRKLGLLFSEAFILAIVVLVVIARPAYADSTQVYASVSLQDFTIQVQYPSVVLPGTNTQVNVQAIAKSAVALDSLIADIYYVDGANLRQVTSATIVGSQNVASGNTFTNDIPITVPQEMPRTSLFATFTEAVKFGYVSSYSYTSYYNGYDYGCSSYPGYSYNNTQYCSYYPYYNSYSSYPQYSYMTITDTGISPLSYVNATTPEYTSLLSQYQTQQQQLSQAQSQNQNLQQQLTQQNQQISQLQAQVQQLQNNLQSAQSTISQASFDNSNLNSQLNYTNAMNRYVTYLVIAFGIIAILALVLSQHSKQPRKTQSVNPYAANYVPPQTEHS